MRAMGVNARLLAATAICLTMTVPVYAQDNGLESGDATPISNPSGSSIQGAKKGVYSYGTQLILDNEGTIRGDGLAGSVFNSDGGIIISGGPATITNSGDISGARFGITTNYYTNPDGSTEGRAIGSTIDNSGTIIGDSDDGIRLIGGGDVVNSGYIAGRVGVGADGVSMFSFNGQDLGGFTVIGSVTNLAGATIEGDRFGVILSNGGIVANEGTISGNRGSILIQALPTDPGRTALVTNSGTLNGEVGFNYVAATVENSGTIASPTAAGISIYDGSLIVTNSATGSISGATRGISANGSSLTLDNEGTIRGNGNGNDQFEPDAGIVISGASNNIDNSGTISGQQFGITTSFFFNDETGQYEVRATDNHVVNSGSIIGDNDDGVRLIGGGTVTNSGTIAGRVGSLADGISMFSFDGQDLGSFTVIGTVTNLEGGVIEGNRLGIILSNGGIVDNAGTINGGTSGAILIQAQDFDPGRTGIVTNSGSINGSVRFNGLANAELNNSGSITAVNGWGTHAAFGMGDLSIVNEETGSITGSTSGIFSQASTLSLINYGTIRGNGTYDGFEQTPDGGATVSGGPATIQNYGSITGQRFGITTIYSWDPETELLEGLAIGSTVENEGTIIGDTDDGIRLIGGGTVTNSGYIAGRVGATADGVSMFAFDTQALDSFVQIGAVTNLADGTIEGNRFGIILSGGGTVDNAGVVSGNTGGVQIQAFPNDPGRTGIVTNSGTINGRVSFYGLADATVTNSGAITDATSGVFADSSLTLDNSGTIRGNGNNGSLNTPDGGVVVTGGAADITNSGTISGQQFGISTALYLNPVTNQLEPRAIGSTVENSGTIIGDNSDGVRLVGGGTVTNSGYIAGRVGSVADGISMFSHAGQDTSGLTSIGTVTNLAGGIIEGNRFGIILSGGGTIDNAGTITGLTNSGLLIQGAGAGKVGTLINSGTINRGAQMTFLDSASATNSGTIIGVMNFFGITDASLDNSGTITGTAGFTNITNASMTNSGSVDAFTYFNNVATASLTNSGALNDYVSFEGGGTATLDNSGSIFAANGVAVRGYNGGLTIANSGSITSMTAWAIHGNIPTITNSETGSITGAMSGIWGQGPTFTLTNYGSIRGNGGYDGWEAAPDGGVLFSGGPGTIQNYGTISGQRFGITSAYNWNSQTQQLERLTIGNVVENHGSIIGDTDAGIRLIGGGDVTNSGYIAGRVSDWADGIIMFSFDTQDLSGVTGIGTVTNIAGGLVEGNRFGVVLSNGGAVDNAGTISGNSGGILIENWRGDPGRIGTVSNNGAVNGSVAFDGLASATLDNSGSITATSGSAIESNSGLAVTNTETGSITGAYHGMIVYSGASLTLDNAGTIRGNSVDGIYVASGSADITNSGTISGQWEGITTENAVTTISNSGLIVTDIGHAILLVSGGSVTNIGQITSGNTAVGSGIYLNAVGTVTNLAGGVISGQVGVDLQQGGTITNSGTIFGGYAGISSGGSATITNSGTIAGGGGPAIVTAGPTTLVNSGAIGATGANPAVWLSNSNDSVTLLTGSSINGFVHGNAGTDSVTLSGTINLSTPLQTVGHFEGFETLNVLGGYWSAPTNAGGFTSTTISGGTLAINGTITSPIVVSPAAKLGGTGTITGNVTVNGGAYLAPGNSIGALNVTGNVNFGAGSIFQVETTPSGLADKLAVNGNVTIGNGASVQVLAGSVTSEGYAANTIYTILTANSITGKFGSVTTDLAFLKPILAHKSKEILLTLARNGKPLTSASTANTFGTASAVEGLGEGSPIYQAVLVQSFDGAQQAFSSLSGGALADLHSLIAEDFGQLQLGFEAAETSGPTLQWSGSNSLQASGFHSGSTMSHGPISVMLVGGQQAGHLSTDHVSGEVQTRFVGGAVGYRSGRLQAMAGVTSGWHEISVSRTISFPGFADYAGSRYSAVSRRLQGEVSYTLSRGRTGIAPYAGYTDLTIETPAFREQGGASALSFEQGASSVDQLELGIRMRSGFDLGRVTFAPRLDLSLRRTRSDDERSASFANGSDQFDSIGSRFEGRSVAIDAGIDLNVGPLRIAGSYQGQLGEQWQDHRALLSASLRF